VADQRGLCRQVLQRLAEAGVLDEVVLVGSWCLEGYRDYFGRTTPLTTLRTRDVDFLVPRPQQIHRSVDVSALLRDAGFMADYLPSGLLRFMHPDLIVEFLVPEHGRGTDEPVRLPQLNVNAQALRFLDMLAERTVSVTLEVCVSALLVGGLVRASR